MTTSSQSKREQWLANNTTQEEAPRMAVKWSRQTYQAVADVLFEARELHSMEENYQDSSPEAVIARIAQKFEALFANDNARFDRERFEAAVYRDHEDNEDDGYRFDPVTGESRLYKEV